jgi:hypothetical protein
LVDLVALKLESIRISREIGRRRKRRMQSRLPLTLDIAEHLEGSCPSPTVVEKIVRRRTERLMAVVGLAMEGGMS